MRVFGVGDDYGCEMQDCEDDCDQEAEVSTR